MPNKATWAEAPRLVRRLKRWEENVGKSLSCGFYVEENRGRREGRFRIGYFELFQWGHVGTWGGEDRGRAESRSQRGAGEGCGGPWTG